MFINKLTKKGKKREIVNVILKNKQNYNIFFYTKSELRLVLEN